MRYWQRVTKFDTAACALADRHYSRRKPGSGQFMPPGQTERHRGDPMTPWRKSTYSAESANCVEVAHTDTEVWLRDSKHPRGPVLRLEPDVWRRFVAAVSAGEFGRAGDGARRG